VHARRSCGSGPCKGRPERLHRTLDLPAGRHLRADRHCHARRPGAGPRAAVADGMAFAARPAQGRPGRQSGCDAMTALVVNRLCKSFGGLRVTADVDLVVEPGERRLIIGPNGAGKTTLFNLIMGELTPDSGSI